MTETLRERITAAQLAVYDANDGSASDDELSDAAIAAFTAWLLSDAAVERTTGHLHESPYSQCNQGSDTCATRPLVRFVLQAALTTTPTETSGNAE